MIRRIRNFLGLRQQDVSTATGISVARLGAAENGRQLLNRTEMQVLREFLLAHMRMLFEEGIDLKSPGLVVVRKAELAPQRSSRRRSGDAVPND